MAKTTWTTIRKKRVLENIGRMTLPVTKEWKQKLLFAERKLHTARNAYDNGMAPETVHYQVLDWKFEEAMEAIGATKWQGEKTLEGGHALWMDYCKANRLLHDVDVDDLLA